MSDISFMQHPTVFATQAQQNAYMTLTGKPLPANHPDNAPVVSVQSFQYPKISQQQQLQNMVTTEGTNRPVPVSSSSTIAATAPVATSDFQSLLSFAAGLLGGGASQQAAGNVSPAVLTTSGSSNSSLPTLLLLAGGAFLLYYWYSKRKK